MSLREKFLVLALSVALAAPLGVVLLAPTLGVVLFTPQPIEPAVVARQAARIGLLIASQRLDGVSPGGAVFAEHGKGGAICTRVVCSGDGDACAVTSIGMGANQVAQVSAVFRLNLETPRRWVMVLGSLRTEEDRDDPGRVSP